MQCNECSGSPGKARFSFLLRRVPLDFGDAKAAPGKENREGSKRSGIALRVGIQGLPGGVRNPVHRTCLAVMYACGLRVGEATTLEVTAVDRARRVLRIVGKGDKERLVPLPQPVLDDLGRVWLTHRNRRWLFPNRRGDAPLNRRTLSGSFADAAVAAGLPSGRHATHAARQLCHPPARERRRHTCRAGLARPRPNRHDDDLHHLTTPTLASLQGLLDRLMTGL